jgi:hypothetical protein
MNADHKDALVLLARQFAHIEAQEARMTTVDRLGFHALENPRWHAGSSHSILARSEQLGRNQKGSRRDGAASALGSVMTTGRSIKAASSDRLS